MTEIALCAYAVVPAEAPVPEDPAVTLVREGPVAALVGSVNRAEFEAGPEGRGEDPAWVAARAAAHHAIVAAATMRGGPVLPLALGALFSSEAPLRRWLADRAEALGGALAAIAGCEEWVLSLREDPAAHQAWLAAHDRNLKALAEEARTAGAGRGFLIARQRDRLAAALMAGRRRSLGAEAADAFARHARRMSTDAAAAARWNGLVPRQAVGALRSDIEALAREMARSGVTLSLSGPWPAYTFAREAMGDA